MNTPEEKFKIQWQAEDGYVSGTRPQYTRLYAADIEGHLSDEELGTLLELAIEDDFRNRVTWALSERERSRFMEWAKAVRDANKDEA